MKTYIEEEHGGRVVFGGEVKVEERYCAPTLIDSPKTTS